MKIDDLVVSMNSNLSSGVRYRRDNCYETYVTHDGKQRCLGSYSTEEEATLVVSRWRIQRFVDCVLKYEQDVLSGVIYENNYVCYADGLIFNLHGRLIHPKCDRNGYLHGLLNGKQKQWHRVVAECFLDRVPGYSYVNHINGCKSDNRVCNLEWCTRSENAIHAYRQGLEKKVLGMEHHNHKLTDNDVRYIRSVYQYKHKEFGCHALAKKYHVDPSTILAVVKNETWRHIV